MLTAQANPKGFDIVIVGAGLSGLVALKQLIDSPSSARIREVHLIEASEKAGGRLRSIPGGTIDLGASWSWQSDNALRKLLRDLSINTLDQPWEGNVVTVNAAGSVMKREARYGESPCGAGGQRMAGGASQLPAKLLEYIGDLRASNKVKYSYGTSITAIGAGGVEEEDVVEVELSNGETLTASAVIMACPPAAIAKIEFLPSLPPLRKHFMEATKTWMVDILKFVAVYPTKFWKDEGLSGFGILQQSHLVETTWDASDGGVCAISGFARPTARGNSDAIKANIVADLTKCFGEGASSPSDVSFIDWSYSNFNVDQAFDEKLSQHLDYGHNHLRNPFDRRVVFAGTESEKEAGHMEGAIKAGVRAANEAFEVALGRGRKSII